MSNPRNDQSALDAQFVESYAHMGEDCAACGPTWWGLQRGCYEQAKDNYADPKRRVVFGHVYQQIVFRDPFTGATVKEQIEK